MHNFSIQVNTARTFFRRLIGLLGKNIKDVRFPLYIPHCKQIHTVGMKFALDLVFVNKQGVIVDIQIDIKPNGFSRYASQAYGVIEFVAGGAVTMGLQIGDTVALQEVYK